MKQTSLSSLFQPLSLLILSAVLVATAEQSLYDKDCGYNALSSGCPAGCHLTGDADGPTIYCILVPPGFYSGEGQNNFVPCPSGQYSPDFGASSCLPCAVGTFAGQIGSSSCQTCPINTYQDDIGQKDCKPCDANTHIGIWIEEFCERSSSPTAIETEAPSASPSLRSTMPSNAKEENDDPSKNKGSIWSSVGVVAAGSLGIFGLATGTCYCSRQLLQDDRAAANESTMAQKGDGSIEMSRHTNATPLKSPPPAPDEAPSVEYRPEALDLEDVNSVLDSEDASFEDIDIEIDDDPPEPRPDQQVHIQPPNFVSPLQRWHNHEQAPLPDLPAVSPYEYDFSYPVDEESVAAEENLNRYEFVNMTFDSINENKEMESDDDCYTTEELNESTAAIMSPSSAAWRWRQENGQSDADDEVDGFAGIDVDLSPMSHASTEK